MLIALFAPETVARFWSRVDSVSDPDGHWLWTGHINHAGYGQVSCKDIMGKWHNFRAHRFAYLATHGEIPDDKYALHQPPCVIRHCVCHVYLGTPQDNTNDMVSLGRSAKGDRSGRRLHPESVLRGEECNLAKLTPEDIIRIRSLRRKVSQPIIAAEYHIHQSNVSQIQLHKSWQHIDTPEEVFPYTKHGAGAPHATLTESQVQEIRNGCTGKYGQQIAFARKYGVSEAAISHIVHRRSWQHI